MRAIVTGVLVLALVLAAGRQPGRRTAGRGSTRPAAP